jgi:PilZ domain
MLTNGLMVFRMGVEVPQEEKRATRRFALRLPVSVNYAGDVGTALSAETRDVSARGVCFYLDAPLATGSPIEFTLTLPPEITLTESIRVRCKGKVVRTDNGLADAKVPVAAVIEEYEFLSQ